MRTLDTLLYHDGSDRLTELAAGKTVIAIDILRATTTLCVAFRNGLAAAVPVLTPEEAFEVKERDYPDALLGGERGGVLIDGFDLSNSPREYTSDAVRGRTLVFTTTNGTQLMRGAMSARRVLVGAFVNRSAVCDAAVDGSNDVLVACAGTHGAFTLEDALFAGACVERLEASFDVITDAALAARTLWERFGSELEASLAIPRHGQSLIALGLKDDLAVCADMDLVGVVPELSGGVLRLS
ncbi:MAG: 2-phosphosulfolactate phosphatase [Candidatus Poribacteria bacterium]|nr:2-phosphosulfolactate phosphatase [Candidatus Poribacteria bacterium]